MTALWKVDRPGQAVLATQLLPRENNWKSPLPVPCHLGLVAAPLLSSAGKSGLASFSGMARSWSDPWGSPRASCNHFIAHICKA